MGKGCFSFKISLAHIDFFLFYFNLLKYITMLYSGIPKIVWYFYRVHTIQNYYKILTRSLVLCISSLGLIYFITGSLYLSIPFAYSPFLLPLSPLVTLVSSVCTRLLCSLDATSKWKHAVFVFLWLISLSIMPSGSIHVVKNDKIPFFLMDE